MTHPTRSRLPLATLGAVALAMAHLPLAGQSTGFNQTAAGPWDYNTSGNWVGGIINGVWASDLTLTAAQVVTFDADTVLSTGFNFGYAGNFGLTFQGSGANRTITLGGDISVAPVANQTITFGSTTAGQNLNVNLGGNRTFTVAANKTLRFFNSISGGDLTISGNANLGNGGTVVFSGESATASSSAIRITRAGFLSVTSTGTGATRAQSIELAGGNLAFTGNGTQNTTETISGVLTVAEGRYNSVTLTAGSGRHLQLNAGSLARSGTGGVLFRGTNLGVNAISTPTANSTNIAFTAAPLLTAGTLGTKSAGIIPWAVVDTTASGLGSSFATYDAVRGVRALDASEFSTTIATDGTTTGHNIKLTSSGTALTVNGATTVNSLFIDHNTQGAGSVLSGTGSLTISSGALFVNIASMSGSNGATVDIAKNINFGSTQGILGTSGNAGQRRISFSGGISGTGGLVFYDTGPNAGQAAGFFLNHPNTYSGDTYINGTVTAAANNALPNFSNAGRTGDVFLNGTLKLSTTGATIQINGLWGNGTVHSEYTNSNKTLLVGDGNATSTFDGRLAGGGGSMNLAKMGTGTLTLTGTDSAYVGTTAVRNGTLSVVTLNRVVGGAASSTLGAPVTVANATIALGDATTTGTLRVNGTGETTDRVINLAGTTGGGGIEQAGTGLLRFTSDFTATGAGSKTLTLSGSTAGIGEIAGAIVNNSASNRTSLLKEGTGTWVLSGVNTYTGTTTVSAGRLALGASDRIADASNLIMAGGIFDTGGFSETLGTLSVTASSIIDLGFGASALAFADSSAAFWGGSVSLSFVNYTFGLDSIRFGTDQNALTGAQLSQITVNGVAAAIDSNGYLTAIPEPSAFAGIAGLGALGFAALRRRRARA